MGKVPAIRPPAFALLPYGLAVALVAAALGLTLLLQSVVSVAGYIFFYIAVVASAWFGGRWPGWIAVILSAVAVAYFFIEPARSFVITREAAPIFLEFAITSSVVGWFSSWRKEAESELQRRVDQRTTELREKNEHLLNEMAERKRAEDAYYEAQAELARLTRLSAMGALAASISHEVNQPLAAVVTNADACLMWLSSNPPNLDEARAALESVAREGTRASEVVRRVRAMFANAKPERTTLQMNDLIREVVVLLAALAQRSHVQIETALEPGLPATLGDHVQLQQVLVNLIQNGIEAMRDLSDRPRRLLIRSQTSDSGRILISVRDSGVGIQPKDEKRIFDAFFTTKAQGMGMGLSICNSIIESHGGKLWAAANADHGATFQFTLPAEPAAS
ncbi:MAG TPA: ATP-binding protein [Bryobacteraceae bacterium]|nr:ATP-binding protein [Bryobacteraceae bacterium]